MPTLELLPLTTRNQVDVLEAIERSHIHGSEVPSYKDLAAAVPGINSFTSVLAIVKQLRQRGYLGEGGGRPRTFEVRIPILAPCYIGALDLFDGSLSLGYPKKIPHCLQWKGCVGLELEREDGDRCWMEGDILILKPVRGYHGQSLGRLVYWEGESLMGFQCESPGLACFQVAGVWRHYD